MRISDWSSDVCSSDLLNELRRGQVIDIAMLRRIIDDPAQPDVAAVGAERTNLIHLVVLAQQTLCISLGLDQIRRASCRERVWQSVLVAVCSVYSNKHTTNNLITQTYIQITRIL